LAKAVEVFGSRAAVRAWWTKPALGLCSYAAAELVSTDDGRQRLLAFLDRLEAGVYS